MRRISLVGVTLCVASVMAATLSFVTVSEASPESEPHTSKGVEDRVLNESPKNPYHQVIDNSDAAGFEAKGYQTKASGEGAFGEDYAVATGKAAPASFEFEVPETRYYSVWARWPVGAAAEAARMGIPSSGGVRWETVDQTRDGGIWVRIGAYEMREGRRSIQLQSGAVADAVMIVGDALVGKDGRTASVADPYSFAADAEDQATLSKSSAAMKARPTPADVMRVARTHLGTRYGNATCRAYAQEDCSCFTKLVFQRFGHNFADSPVYQWNMKWGQKFRSKSRLRNGDIVFSDLNKNGVMNPYDHVSIWAGRGNVIHASSYFGEVVISEERYLRNFYGAKRFALR